LSGLTKMKNRLKSLPKDYSYKECKTLLEKLGFVESTKGKTSGSRIKFFRQSDSSGLFLHKPHGNNPLNPLFVKDLLELLKKSGDID